MTTETLQTDNKMDTDSVTKLPESADNSRRRDSMQTGLFLQHFTNSVNRALHKENCTCNGKLYTADELLSKSNTAIYGPSKSHSTPKVSKTRKVHLPPINGLNLTDDSSVVKTAAPLKTILNREVNFTRPVRNERLVTRSAPAAAGEELRLPSIMDIRDTKGNSWKILQETSGPSHHRGQKPLQLIRQMLNKNAFYNPHIYIPTDVNGIIEEDIEVDQDGDAIESVLEANTPINSVYDLGEVRPIPSRVDEIADVYGNSEEGASTFDSESDIDLLDPSFNDLAPSVSNLTGQIKGIRKYCHGNCDDVYHDENERKALLSKYSSEVRRRKISYIEYLRKVSQMTLCPCLQLAVYRQRDKRMSDVQIEIMSAKRVLTAASRLTLKSRSLPAPDFASNIDTLSLYARGDQYDITDELDNLYDRGAGGIATLQIGGDEHLPKNFLEREREELRLMYPMYDWRVQYNQQLLIGQLNRSMPSLQGSTRNVPVKKTEPIKPSQAKRKDNHEKSVQSTEKQVVGASTQKTQLDTMTGQSMTLSSPNITQHSSESLSKPRIPNQPPPTPMEQSVTIASASAPELLTINESEESRHEEDDQIIDDNNNEIENDKAVVDQEDSVKSDQFVKSNVSDTEVEQNGKDLSQTENNVTQAPKTIVDDLKYAEQNSSIHLVSPASTASNSAVNVTVPMPVLSTTEAPVPVVRPSVQLLQIDANVASKRKTEQLLMRGAVNKGGEIELPSESVPKHLRPTGVARLATHQVVFVSPATTQA